MICCLAAIAAWPLVTLAQTAPPEVIAPPAGTGSAAGIQQHAQGVIHPPAVDPAIVKPTPPIAPQSMPVIPPPGTAGSKSNVEPK